MILNRASASLLRTGTALGRRPAATATASGAVRHGSTSGPGLPAPLLGRWYSTFGKSNVMYISWCVAGILIAEAVTGAGTDALWNSVNKGRTYDSVDWSKFVVEDEDEEEDEEEEDDEEGGGGT